MEKLVAKMMTLTTAKLVEVAKLAAPKADAEHVAVLQVAMDILIDRMPEQGFCDFCADLEGVMA